METAEQSIKNGTKVEFDLQGMRIEFEEDCPEAVNYHEKIGTVDSLETATELGEQDYEYYNVTFEDGFQMTGVSGYHLIVQ